MLESARLSVSIRRGEGGDVPAVQGCASLGVADAFRAGQDCPGPRQKVDSAFHAHPGTDIRVTGSRETPYLTALKKGETGQLEDTMPLKRRARVPVRRCEVAVPSPSVETGVTISRQRTKPLQPCRTEEESPLEPNESLSAKLLSNKNISM